jgi:hypothetical protein
MDPNVKLALEGLIIFLMTAGIKGIAKQFNIDIEGKFSVLVAALVGSAVLLADAGFALIPVAYQPLVGTIVLGVAAILSAAGVYKTTQAMSPQ